jgi:acyl-CoA thioester hydrolase
MTSANDWRALPVTHRAVVPNSYLDEMGHMNVMWYTHLFSLATGGFFELLGLTHAYFEANQAGTFALEMHLRYLTEVRVGYHLTIRSRILGRSAKRLHFMNFMVIDEKSVLAATAESTAAHIDMRIRRSSPLPAPIVEATDRLLAEHARLPWEPPVCGVMKP